MLAFVPNDKSNLDKESLNFELPSKEYGNKFEFDLVTIKPDQLNRKVLRCSVLFTRLHLGSLSAKTASPHKTETQFNSY